jgi:hypothetical protein
VYLSRSGALLAADVDGIPSDIAQRADAYRMYTRDGLVSDEPWHCVAGFIGPELERLTCTNERAQILEATGKAELLYTVKRAIDALSPSIRRFNNREKGLADWQVAREDDVRDLLYAMLRSSMADIHTEEPIPSIAGTHKFVDLASRIARLLIEVKWIATRGTYNP